jgi:hypothetical protein
VTLGRVGFRLYAIPAAGLDWQRTGRLIGDFVRLEQPQLARDADTLNQLRNHGGWRLRVSHAIVDSNADTEAEISVTSLGVPPDRPRPPDGDDLAAEVEWLVTGRRLGL